MSPFEFRACSAAVSFYKEREKHSVEMNVINISLIEITVTKNCPCIDLDISSRIMIRTVVFIIIIVLYLLQGPLWEHSSMAGGTVRYIIYMQGSKLLNDVKLNDCF